MYKPLAKKLSNIFASFSKKTLSHSDIEKAMEAVEHALIDADVALEAIAQFKDHIMQASLDTEKIKDLAPKAQIMHLVKQALLDLLKSEDTKPLSTMQPNKMHIILMVGLQGAGKTTSCAKIAHYIQNTFPNKSIMMASTDIYRPAAIEQLHVLASRTNCNFHPHAEGITPLEISKQALDHAKRTATDILIIDTAGRLEIDQQRMNEIKDIHRTVKPHETIYVVDSMVGQGALATAKTFNDTVDITGVILSKIDSDTKGGVALSMRYVLKKPIYWLGVGEDISQFDLFDPERLVNQILDMGDIIGLAQHANKHIDEKKAKNMAKRLQKGQFTFTDMLEQIEQIHKLGGMTSILKMLPGSAQIPDNIMKMAGDESRLTSIKALIQSMTVHEKMRPELMRNHKRRQMRVVNGSGRTQAELKQLLANYDKIKKMTEKLKGGKMKAMMEKFKQMGEGGESPWG